MDKFFNTAGPCREDLHYMIDPLPRLSGVQELIDGQHYFAMYAPRQTGKTTYLYALMEHLNHTGDYTALAVNIQLAAGGQDSKEAMRIVAAAIYRQANLYLLNPECPEPVSENDSTFDNLQDYLSDWAKHNRKPIVLLLDEVDALPAHYFLDLMRQLRAGFELRPRGFPQSIGLVGLRDIQDYKLQGKTLHGSNELGMLSPFNVKSISIRLRGFNQAEMSALLKQHSEETGQDFDEAIQAEIFRLTQGQPWLVNALINQIVARLLDNKYQERIQLEHVEQAMNALIKRNDTHLDNFMHKLHEPLVKLVVEAVINGEVPDFKTLKDALSYTRGLGLIAAEPPIRFDNPVYQEMTLRSLSIAFQESLPCSVIEAATAHLNPFDFNALLEPFQTFYRRSAELWVSRFDFKEAGRQLLFIGFLFRVFDGKANFEWDLAVGNSRCDVIIIYQGEKIALTLKLRHDSYVRDEGLNQISDLIKKHNLDQGYLILFDVFWEERIYREELELEGKKVILLGM